MKRYLFMILVLIGLYGLWFDYQSAYAGEKNKSKVSVSTQGNDIIKSLNAQKQFLLSVSQDSLRVKK